jgi:hypothetical protein
MGDGDHAEIFVELGSGVGFERHRGDGSPRAREQAVADLAPGSSNRLARRRPLCAEGQLHRRGGREQRNGADPRAGREAQRDAGSHVDGGADVESLQVGVVGVEERLRSPATPR